MEHLNLLLVAATFSMSPVQNEVDHAARPQLAHRAYESSEDHLPGLQDGVVGPLVRPIESLLSSGQAIFTAPWPAIFNGSLSGRGVDEERVPWTVQRPDSRAQRCLK